MRFTMHRTIAILMTAALSALANPTYYDWSGAAFARNNGAANLEWQLEEASSLVSNDWNAATNLSVESI